MANKYVTPSGAGAGDGSDWANAYSGLPSSLNRGDTYYIASGNYGGYTFNDPNSGSTYIYIRKATASDHGDNTGWQSSYGIGPAVFGSSGGRVFDFESGYYDIDGVTGGGPGSWESGHGIRVIGTGSSTTTTVNFYMGNSEAKYIYLRHIEATNNAAYAMGDNEWTGSGYGKGDIVLANYSGDTMLITYCWFHHAMRTIFRTVNWKNITVEYSKLGRNGVNRYTGNHSETWAHRLGSYTTIRYCWIHDWVSTGGIILGGDDNGSNYDRGSDHVEIYGNIFQWRKAWASAANNGVIGGWSHSGCHGVKIYNNVICGTRQSSAGKICPVSWTPSLGGPNTDWVCYNNIWYDLSNPSSIFGQVSAHDYNYTPSSQGESHGQVSTANPFVNYGNDNFYLSSPTNDGLSLSSPYNKDMDGNTRGTDGVWDRGAYEYGGTGPGPEVYLKDVTDGLIIPDNPIRSALLSYYKRDNLEFEDLVDIVIKIAQGIEISVRDNLRLGEPFGKVLESYYREKIFFKEIPRVSHIGGVEVPGLWFLPRPIEGQTLRYMWAIGVGYPFEWNDPLPPEGEVPGLWFMPKPELGKSQRYMWTLAVGYPFFWDDFGIIEQLVTDYILSPDTGNKDFDSFLFDYLTFSDDRTTETPRVEILMRDYLSSIDSIKKETIKLLRNDLFLGSNTAEELQKLIKEKLVFIDEAIPQKIQLRAAIDYIFGSDNYQKDFSKSIRDYLEIGSKTLKQVVRYILSTEGLKLSDNLNRLREALVATTDEIDIDDEHKKTEEKKIREELEFDDELIEGLVRGILLRNGMQVSDNLTEVDEIFIKDFLFSLTRVKKDREIVIKEFLVCLTGLLRVISRATVEGLEIVDNTRREEEKRYRDKIENLKESLSSEQEKLIVDMIMADSFETKLRERLLIVSDDMVLFDLLVKNFDAVVRSNILTGQSTEALRIFIKFMVWAKLRRIRFLGQKVDGKDLLGRELDAIVSKKRRRFD